MPHATPDAAAEAARDELLRLSQQLLDSISQGDWPTYEALCHPELTAFEPEARGQLVAGLDFHRYYFDLPGRQPAPHRRNTITAPVVQLLGSEAAVVTYVRLVQFVDDVGHSQTARFEETRVWQRIDGHWRHMHFHRSSNP
ncbi:MAG: DUF4440 domain-containing protein [Pirellulaceae bacterium]|nr:DUF4440 domain-containing protein [Pirellulaceae bacterium]